MTEPGGIRLQKALTAVEVASRRASEILISEGRVEVNGRVVSGQGRRVDPGRDTIRVNEVRIPPPHRHRCLVLNKPRGVVSTTDNPGSRRTLVDYLPRRSERLFHIGRLDTDTEGLILLTSDDEFAHRLSHPGFEIPKTCMTEVADIMDQQTIQRLKKGLRLEDGSIKPDRVEPPSRGGPRLPPMITLHESRNHATGRMMDPVGHPVNRLVCTGIGPVRLGRLIIGATRELTHEELGVLPNLVGMRGVQQPVWDNICRMRSGEVMT